MLYRNRHLDDAFEFIRSAPYDVFCLQEVPDGMLERLGTLPGELAFRRDVEKVYADKTVSMHNVILSKYAIRASAEIDFPDYDHGEHLRTRLFRRIMPMHFPETRDRGGLYADVDVDGQIVRVFNVHLILARPAWRLEEFERAMAERDPSLPTIVCGDFNTLEKPHITVLNWLFGAPLSHAALYRRERFIIEKRFVTHGLWNPLRGHPTHGMSRSQLDHILVSRQMAVSRAEVVRDRRGSDHHPIFAAISLDGNSGAR
ncbi:MAG TPA: endonuclease/exonuclease/phosphatase family protein [Candidatus Paceibacterota bacterium]|nr:endonuclease/exonuclease/phosphatase family protein [Candidatus Paceibacterota bacterium]